MEVLTHSRLKTFRQCARKEKLSYQDGFRPIRESEALRDGTLIHEGLEAWWKSGGSLGAMVAPVENADVDQFTRARIHSILIGYHRRWIDELPDFEILSVEGRFEIPLLHPVDLTPHPGFVIAGKVDVLAQRGLRNLVIEHKTTSSAIDSDADAYWQRLAMDHQLSIYFMGAEQLGGIPVDECLYDVIRKPSLRPLKATPPDVRKYKKDGSLYANQREEDETPVQYRARLDEEIAAQPERYFQRKPIPRTMSQIQEFLFDAWQTAETLADSMKYGRAPRNPEACIPYGAESRCAFFDVCSLGVDPAESDAFRRIENVHPELAMEVV